MKLHRLALLLVTASVLATPLSSAAPATLEARLDSLLAGFRSDYHFPGATVAVALANGETVTVATGFSDVEAGTPMTTGSRMLAASIGKTFVAATVLALDADGRLDCEQRVSNYLGDRAMKEPYLDRMLDGVAVAAGAEQRRYGAGVAIWTDTPRGVVYGHGGWIPGYVASLRHYADHGITVAFQVNTDKGMADSSTNFVPALEAALADLVLEFLREARDPSVTE